MEAVEVTSPGDGLGTLGSEELEALAQLREEARVCEDRAERAERRCEALASAQAASAQDHEAAIRAVSGDVAAVCNAHRQQILKISEAMTELGRDLSSRLERLEAEMAAQRQRIADLTSGKALQAAVGASGVRPNGEMRPLGTGVPLLEAGAMADAGPEDTEGLMGGDLRTLLREQGQQLQAHERELREHGDSLRAHSDELRAQGGELREQCQQLSIAVSSALRRVSDCETCVFNAVIDRLRALAERGCSTNDEMDGIAIAALLAPVAEPCAHLFALENRENGIESMGLNERSAVCPEQSTHGCQGGTSTEDPSVASQTPRSLQRQSVALTGCLQGAHMDAVPMPVASPGRKGSIPSSIPRRPRQQGRAVTHPQPKRIKQGHEKTGSNVSAVLKEPELAQAEPDVELERMRIQVHELEVQLAAARLAASRPEPPGAPVQSAEKSMLAGSAPSGTDPSLAKLPAPLGGEAPLLQAATSLQAQGPGQLVVSASAGESLERMLGAESIAARGECLDRDEPQLQSKEPLQAASPCLLPVSPWDGGKLTSPAAALAAPLAVTQLASISGSSIVAGQLRQCMEHTTQSAPQMAVAAAGAPQEASGSHTSPMGSSAQLPRMASSSALGAPRRTALPYGVTGGSLGHTPPPVAMSVVRPVMGDSGQRATTPTPAQIHGSIAVVSSLGVGGWHSPRGHTETRSLSPSVQALPPPLAQPAPLPARLLRSSSSTPPPSGRSTAPTPAQVGPQVPSSAPWATLRTRVLPSAQ